MIYEIARLPVHKDKSAEFREAFHQVVPLLGRAPGYLGHVLVQGVERSDVFNLIVRWRSLEDHTPAFEGSDDHRLFMEGIERYFSAEPAVQHFEGGSFSVSGREAGGAAAI